MEFGIDTLFILCYNKTMKIDYNIEKIDKLLHDLHLITGLTLGFWDNNMNLMVIYPPEQSSFCREIRATAKGLERCLRCDRIILHHCAITNTVCTRDCHAGIPDSALPLYHNELLLGFITFGQLINLTTNRLSYEEIKSRISDLDIDFTYLSQAYMELPRYDNQRLDAVITIVSACIQQAIITKIVTVKNDNLQESISEFIATNLTDPSLSYKSISKKFHISKSALYNLFNQYFGMSPHLYIEAKRIKLGAELLLNTDKSILDIAISVGIYDQNYFSRCFKKHLTISPSQYRNTFRSSL